MPEDVSGMDSHLHHEKVSFVADVHLIRILGEQLIGSEKVGILELVKNSYDAGASECHVWIERVPGLPEVPPSDPQVALLEGPVITVIDDGRGMDRDTILKGWLRPATRIKTDVKEQLRRQRAEADSRGTRAEYDSLVRELKKEHGGRLPLGEKGVGRFATHRLGRFLILQTKMRHEPCEWLLQIDWTKFDKPDDDPTEVPLDLDAVDMDLIGQDPQRDYGSTESGTMIRIYGGRGGFEWTEKKLLEIGHAIAHLRSPAGDKQPAAFEVFFHCPQLSEEIEVPTDTVAPPFECTAIVDEQGEAEIEIRFNPPESLRRPLPARSWTDTVDLRKPSDRREGGDENYWLSSEDKARVRSPECGPFTVDIKLWLRTGDWIDYADLKSFREYLSEFGGIGVYRDGLGILPAQIASRDDWLRLSTRHIEKGSRISYYNMIGSVDLLQEDTLDLIDRTSREGLLETRPFNDLRELVRNIVFELEFRVMETRSEYTRLRRAGRIPESTLSSRGRVASGILEAVASRYDFKADRLGIRQIIGESEDPGQVVSGLAPTIDYLRQELRGLQTQSDALVEAAGYGIAVAVGIHEIEKVTSNLYYGLERILKRVSPLDTELYDETHRLSQSAKALLNELRRIAPLRVTRLERPKEFRIRDCILAARGAFLRAWEDLGILAPPPPRSSDFEVRGSFAACSQVFANLFDNATYWLRTVDAGARHIYVQVVPGERRVVVADSGPGIDEKMRPHLFELFYSLKSPPSGLGLYICRYYMRQMGGTIRESHTSEELPGLTGAHFTLVFPKEE